MVRTKHRGVKEELNKDVESNEQQKPKAQDGRHHAVQKEPAKEVGTLSGSSNTTDTIQETDIHSHPLLLWHFHRCLVSCPNITESLETTVVRKQSSIRVIEKELPAQNLKAAHGGTEQ